MVPMVLSRVGLMLPPSGLRSVGVLGVALLGSCLAKGWCPVTVGDFNSLVALAWDCSGPSFVLSPSSLVPVSALEGHQKLAGRAAMTFPELTLRSAGGGCACGPRLLL